MFTHLFYCVIVAKALMQQNEYKDPVIYFISNTCFDDFLLHMVVKSDYLSSCQNSPVCSFSADLNHLQGVLICIQRTVETVLHENPRRAAVSEIFKSTHLAPPTMPWLKLQRSHFFLLKNALNISSSS